MVIGECQWSGVATAKASTSLASSSRRKSATIGGREAAIRFMGMTPGLVGVAQANLVVPAGLTPGNHTVSIRIGTGESNPAQITVSAP